MKHLEKIGFLMLLLGVSAGDSEDLWLPIVLIGTGALIMWISRNRRKRQHE